MNAMIEEITAVSTFSPGPTRRLTAIQLLHDRRATLVRVQKAEEKDWSERIAEAKSTLDALIDAEKPPTSKERGDRLDAIQAAKADHTRCIAQKAVETGKRTAAVKANDAALVETIQAQRDPSPQQRLDLGDTVALAEGLELTEGTLELIDAAAREVLGAGGESSARMDDIKELAAAIASLGLSGIHLITPTAEAVEEEGHLADHSAEGEPDEGDVPF